MCIERCKHGSEGGIARPWPGLASLPYEVTGHSRLEFPELIGHHVVRQGSMEFEYGPLALAMKYGGLALVNEIDLLEPSTAAGLNGILDGQPLCIPKNGGELIVPHGIAVVNDIFQPLIRKIEPALQKIHPQHLFDSHGRTAPLTLRVIRHIWSRPGVKKK